MRILVFLFAVFNIITYATFPTSPPDFSWETIPLWMWGSNHSGAFNDTAAKYYSTFPMVTIGGNTGQNNSNPICVEPQKCEEDKIIATLEKIRHYSNSTINLFYLNSFLNWPQFNLSTQFSGEYEKYLLHNKNGKLAYISSCNKNVGNVTIFDLSQNETISIWLNTIIYAMTHKPGIVDGIFVDRGNANLQHFAQCLNINNTQLINKWNNGHTYLFQQTMKIINKYNPNRGVLIANNAYVNGINGRQYENFSESDNWSIPCCDDLDTLISDNGNRINQIHADYCDIGQYCYNKTLSAFLIGAYKYSYYQCSNGWFTNDGWDETWQNKDYFKPLGKPLFNATYNHSNGIYYRQFEYGAKVYLDDKWLYPCIQWSDGSITGNYSHCQRYVTL